MLSHQRAGSSAGNDLCDRVQQPRSTSLSLLSTSCFICELQGCASSEWNDLLTGTPPSAHARFIWASAEHTVTESSRAARTPQSCFTCGSTLSTSATITVLLICGLVKEISPRTALLLFIPLISDRSLGCRLHVTLTDGILSGHHSGCCGMCPSGLLRLFSTSADAYWGGYMKIKYIYHSNLAQVCGTVTSNTSTNGQEESFTQLRHLLMAVPVV